MVQDIWPAAGQISCAIKITKFIVVFGKFIRMRFKMFVEIFCVQKRDKLTDLKNIISFSSGGKK